MKKLRHYRSRLNRADEHGEHQAVATAPDFVGSPCIVTVLPEGYEWLDVGVKVRHMGSLGAGYHMEGKIISPPWSEDGTIRVRVQTSGSLSRDYTVWTLDYIEPIPDEPRTLTLKLTGDTTEESVREALESLRGVEVEES